MKFGIREVLNLSIFDDQGKFVAFLDTLQESGIYTADDKTYVIVKDAIFDTDLLKFSGTEIVPNENLSDFDRECNPTESRTVIHFGKSTSKPCKLIAYGILRKTETGEDVEFTYEIPIAELQLDVNINLNSVGDPSSNYLTFEVLPFNDLGDLYKMIY